MKTLNVFAVSCLLITASASLAQSPAGDGSLTTNPVYEKNCAKCHGKTAEGRHFGGPSLVTEKVTGASADELKTMISNGKGRMPKYNGKLTAEEIDTLVQQIKSTNKK